MKGARKSRLVAIYADIRSAWGASMLVTSIWSTLHGVLMHCFEFGTRAVLIQEHQWCAKLCSARPLSVDVRQIYKRK